MRLSGKSYTEISKSLNVPRSTLSLWLSKIVLSEKFKKRIEARAYKKSVEGLVKRNKNQTQLAAQRAADIRKGGSEEIPTLSTKDLLLVGAALYWAEGYKRPRIIKGRERTHHPVSLTNADPAIIQLFLRFLRERCEVPEGRIRIHVRMFEHQNEDTLVEHWERVTRIPREYIKRAFVGVSRSSMGKRPYHGLQYGIAQVSVSDTKLYHRIMGHIEGLKKFV
mgnify:CR=1 FL=1